MKKIITAILIAIITMSALFISLSLITYKVNSYQFTKDNKTIIFQEMVHFGEDSYFKEVNKDIDYYKSLGYIYFYEMIKVESDNDKKEMITNLGLSEDIFTIISLSTKLESQHNYMKTTDKDINADITAKQLNDNFSKLTLNNNDSSLRKANDIIIDTFSKLTFDNHISTIISKNIMKLGLYVNKVINIQDVNLNKVIIKQRNDVLIKMINSSKEESIYVQYGQLHYKDFESKMLASGYDVKLLDSKSVFK